MKQAIGLKEQIERLQSELTALLGGSAAPAPAVPRKRTMSASARAQIAAAQKARWAKIRGGKAPAKAKRKVSAAARARLSALAKARWARVRKAGGKSLKAA
ncbi:MAG: hypothetical protein ACYDH9_14205 [Limisphaerales bacterium]